MSASLRVATVGLSFRRWCDGFKGDNSWLEHFGSASAGGVPSGLRPAGLDAEWIIDRGCRLTLASPSEGCGKQLKKRNAKTNAHASAFAEKS